MVLFWLLVFRLMAAIPIPGIDAAKLTQFLGSNQLFGFLNIFSGGGLSNLSVMMFGVGPYITATIIMQLLTIVFPNLKKAYYEEGAAGQAKFNRISRYLTVPLGYPSVLWLPEPSGLAGRHRPSGFQRDDSERHRDNGRKRIPDVGRGIDFGV